jgi:hypothetical protein
VPTGGGGEVLKFLFVFFCPLASHFYSYAAAESFFYPHNIENLEPENGGKESVHAFFSEGEERERGSAGLNSGGHSKR